MRFCVYVADIASHACAIASHACAIASSRTPLQVPWLLLERKGKVEVKGKGNLVLWRVRRGGGSEADSANGDGDAATDDLRAHLDELDALDDADAEDKDDTSSSDRALEKKRSSVELRDVAVESPP